MTARQDFSAIKLILIILKYYQKLLYVQQESIAGSEPQLVQTAQQEHIVLKLVYL